MIWYFTKIYKFNLTVVKKKEKEKKQSGLLESEWFILRNNECLSVHVVAVETFQWQPNGRATLTERLKKNKNVCNLSMIRPVVGLSNLFLELVHACATVLRGLCY